MRSFEGWQRFVEWLESRRDRRSVSSTVALALALMSWGVTWAIPALRTQAPASVFTVGVILAALYGGIFPGLIAAAASMVFVETLVSHASGNPFASMPVADWSRAALFVLEAAVVSALNSQRRAAEERLRRREQHLRLLIENSSDVVSIIRTDGTIEFESPSVLALTGFHPGDLTGKNVFEFVHADDHAAARAALATILARPGATSEPLEIRFLGADGTYRTLEAIGKNLVEEPGVNGILIHSRDITVRKQLVREKAARADAETAKRRYLDLVEGLELVVWEADPATRRMTFVSRRVQDVLGYSPETWLQGNWTEHVFADDRARVESAWDEALATGSSDCEYRGTNDAGRVLWLRLVTTANRDEQGQVLQLRGLIVDVTERRQAEATLRATERLAATGRLAASIAHEINNPMAAVTNLVYLIENSSGEEPAKQFARLAQDELKRMAHITRQMLGFYRDSADPARVEIADLLHGVLELYGRKIKNSSVRLEVRDERAPAVLVYAGEIRQVISNLLINAIDAMPDGGRIVVHLRETHDWTRGGRRGARIVVADNGPGIPDALKKRIFEPFFTTKGQKGTGLGLWVSEGIVQKHNGTLRVRSGQRPGRSGTCFSIFLPAAEERANATSAA